MKKTYVFACLVSLGLTSVLLSCHNHDEIGPNDTNDLILEFDNRVGNQDLELKNKTYKNAIGEEFTVTKLSYFVSNLKLKKADGTEVKFPEQYFLTREEDPKTLLVSLKDVPAADYTALSFTIGVDSLRSTADIAQRKGVLDVASYGDDAMYWSWNSGYIFLKFEGLSPVAPLRTSGERKVEVHIGGYGGYTGRTVNNLRTITLSLPTTAQVRKSKTATIHLFADVLKLFEGKSQISFVTTNSVHSPGAGVAAADNSVNMFTVDHVHNGH